MRRVISVYWQAGGAGPDELASLLQYVHLQAASREG